MLKLHLTDLVCLISWLQYGYNLVTIGYNVHRGVVAITTAQLHSTKLELRFCAGSNHARGVSQIRNSEDL